MSIHVTAGNGGQRMIGNVKVYRGGGEFVVDPTDDVCEVDQNQLRIAELERENEELRCKNEYLRQTIQIATSMMGDVKDVLTR